MKIIGCNLKNTTSAKQRKKKREKETALGKTSEMSQRGRNQHLSQYICIRFIRNDHKPHQLREF